MIGKVLILGGYGNFGKRIARALVKHHVPVIIAGRNLEKAHAFASTLPESLATVAVMDITRELASQLQLLWPMVVINTCGPFQTSHYDVARTCIEHHVHYIDLADGRNFVNGIAALDASAKTHQVAVISGASTVPGLSSAVIEHYRHEFAEIDSLTFGISPGQKSERGLATTQAILSYVGKPIKPSAGNACVVYGWQDIYRQEYPELGKRWMANCDIPDLDLLPAHYGIRSIRFSAGLELSFMHLGLWLLSWAVRLGIPLHLPRHAATLLEVSNWFDRFGSAHGGMHIILCGKNKAGKAYERKWFIIAKDGDGPQIPTIPAIILAKKLVHGDLDYYGATPCVAMVTLEEYLSELKGFSISVYAEAIEY